MLYKKNLSKKLSMELFKNPTSEYRGAPFWAWNGELNEGLLGRQIDAFKEMGFGGFHMHSRSGMSMPYLGETFMSRVKFCVEKAKKEKMLAWLYDEDRWPSGFAGGLVTKNEEFRNRFIIFIPFDGIKSDLPREQAIAQGKDYFAVAYDIVLDEEGNLVSAKQMPRDGKAEGQAWYGYVRPYPREAWFNDETYVDAMDEEAIQNFIEITYESYKKAVGEEFDGVVPAIFTDEPHSFRLPSRLLPNPFHKDHFVLPWSRFMQEKYAEIYGGDVFELIPEVMWNLPNGKYSWKRHRFYDFVTELFCRSFTDQCGKWCNENGIAFTGHVMEFGLEYQTNSMGEAMRSYRSFQIPGIDMLCNKTELNVVKQCQSAVHQFGKEAMLCELYGVTNYTFDFRGHKYQGDWLAALGVTVRVPHLSWATMQGEAKRDYPASISYQSPWYKEYKYIEDYYARVNTALTRGTPDVAVGVIHPIESYWLIRGPLSQTKNQRDEMEKNFDNISSWLLEGHFDFDFISESLLVEQISENPRAVGKMEYNVIIVPECITLRSNTVDFLKRFEKNGGKVLFIGDCPAYVDAVENDAVKELYNVSPVVPFKKAFLFEALNEFATVTINNASGVNAENFIYNMRRDGEDKWLFIANRYSYNDVDKWAVLKGGYRNCEDLEITVPYITYPIEYDTLKGTLSAVKFEHKYGKTVINKKLYSNDSLLLKLCAEKEEISGKIVENEDMNAEVDYSFSLKSVVKHKRHEPNVLLLDYFKMALDGENYDTEDEVLRAFGQIRKKVGWDSEIREQPWVIPNEEPSHFVNVKAFINSEIDYTNPVLALELADISEITWNGEKVTAKPDGYYVDESIGKVQLPPLKKGTNELVVKVPLAPRTNIEAMYLLGEFDVRLKGMVATIIPQSETIGFGSIIHQGMPFYGGNIDYDIEIELEKPAAVKIHAYKYAGALLGVSVDGKREGNIVFEPYDFTTNKLPRGKHTITLTCFGNRNNTFGALHWCSSYRSWFGPNAWRIGGDDWSYEYVFADTGILVSPIISYLK